MNEKTARLLDCLEQTHSLSLEDYRFLVENRTDEAAAYAAEKAVRLRQTIYGNTIFIRGLIEVSSVCRNDCLYCGLRRSNTLCQRYRLTPDDILSCCEQGYPLGFRTFVMQGGEDPYYTDELVGGVIRAIKSRWPDCAVTLSLGERSRESYQRLFDAGADRYLLRHETADPVHYGRLHPKEMSFEHRMRCLYELRDIGFQTGCGFMVGSPFQTPDTLAADLKLVETFRPAMCGIGPFIPHHDTPFAHMPAGTVEQTLWLLSLIRLAVPNVLLPATTALGTLNPFGREKGIFAGANVVMPNLSPADVRGKYLLYDNKLSSGEEAAENLRRLADRMRSIGYDLVTDRGDVRP